MKPITNLPTNIITGFLGSGKTTAINYLLSQKPAEERWAVLVNEFGQIGVDEAQIETDDDVHIKELPGGCFCCALGPALTATLATLIRRTRPDRLLIEPTGLGHPTGIIDTLTSDQFKEVIDLQAMICLVDPRNLSNQEIASNPVFLDQVQLSDVLVFNKADLFDADLMDRVTAEASELFPPKQAVFAASQGKIPLEMLAYQPDTERTAQFPEAHHAHKHHHHHAQPVPQPAAPEKPARLIGSDGQFESCGWVFHSDSLFDPTAVYDLIRDWPDLIRAKGVFRIGDMRISINRVSEECYSQPISYRRDSRLELISQVDQDWDAFESALLKCLC